MAESTLDILHSEFRELFELVDDITTPFLFHERFREFGVYSISGPNHSVSESFHLLSYCPCTGKQLPTSLRYKFFEEIEAIGFDDPWDEGLPSRFKNGDWWSSE